MARIRIQNCDSSNQVDANMLLDTGAKRTYITMEKAQKMGLKIGPKREVKLNTFGSTKPSNMLVQETDLIIKQKDGSKKTVCAKICKNITGPMLVQKLEIMKYRNIWKDLDMADGFRSYDGKYDVDILIGNDYYDDIVKAEKIKVDEGLYLVNSTLGWMFSGRTIREKCEDVELSLFVEENDTDISQFWILILAIFITTSLFTINFLMDVPRDAMSAGLSTDLTYPSLIS